MSATAEEALKAIEILTRILSDEMNRTVSPVHDTPASLNIRERLRVLDKGCCDLRAGIRGSIPAQEIIAHPELPEAPSQLQPGSAAAPADPQVDKETRVIREGESGEGGS